MSNVYPSCLKERPLPPVEAFFSKSVTRKPFCAREHAEAKPANPPPITAIFLGDEESTRVECLPQNNKQTA